MMWSVRKLNAPGWAAFAISLVVYLLSLEPSVSFWDCGEFISAAYKLQIGHPPGAPLYLLLGRVFSLGALGNTEWVAAAINSLSAVASAATVMFLFWTMVRIGQKALKAFRQTQQLSPADEHLLMLVAWFSALAFGFTDTFWFSAVEAEVYALSSLFTAVVFWAILRWDAEAESAHSFRWLVLIAYLMGLSIGVHLLNQIGRAHV